MTPRWVRCSGLTLGVLVDPRGTIVDAPELIDSFIGQPFSDLLRWVERFETFEAFDADTPPTD